jgi:hypothetical protein
LKQLEVYVNEEENDLKELAEKQLKEKESNMEDA